MRGDRREEASVTRILDGAAAVSPDHHWHRVALRESVKARGTECLEAGGAGGGLCRDLVGAGLRLRCALFGKGRSDHLGSDAAGGLLGAAYAAEREQCKRCESQGYFRHGVPPTGESVANIVCRPFHSRRDTVLPRNRSR
jgi:hypothetical protein